MAQIETNNQTDMSGLDGPPKGVAVPLTDGENVNLSEGHKTAEHTQIMNGQAHIDELGLEGLKIDPPTQQEDLCPARKSTPAPSQDIIIRPYEIRPERGEHVPIVLVAGNGREIRPRLGIYNIEGRFLRPAKIAKWVMVILFDKQAVEDLEKGEYTFHDIEAFSERYVQHARHKGIDLTPLTQIHCVPSKSSIERNFQTMPREELQQELRQLFTRLTDSSIDHAIIILPNDCPSWVHGYLQYLEACKCDTSNNPGKLTRTSRVRYETLMNLGIKSPDKGKQSLIPSLWLKYNTKLGGTNVSFKRTFDNHEMRFLGDGYLILSIDIYHQRHQDEEAETLPIAVTVGMWDLASPHISFYTETRVQPLTAIDASRMAVEDLDQMVRQIILSYKKRKNGTMPQRIVIFRSGAYKSSDDDIAKQEISQIKRVLQNEQTNNLLDLPLLTYLKVPKANKTCKYSKPRNVPPPTKLPENSVQTGSLVNSIMTNQSLGPRQASERTRKTSNPDRPRSNVFRLYDDAKMHPKDMQTMIHALSFLSPRVTARTRPTPIDLADLAGERTSNIVNAWMADHQMHLGDNQLIEKLNDFLANKFGSGQDYKSNLYYA